MFYFDNSKKEDALAGRTITYIAKQIGVTVPFVTAVLNGYRGCSKLSAYAITKTLNSEAEIKNYFMFKK